MTTRLVLLVLLMVVGVVGVEAQSQRAYERANDNASFKRDAVSVPEPTTAILLGLGFLGVGVAARLRRR